MRSLSEQEPNNVRIWFASFCHGCQLCEINVEEHESSIPHEITGKNVVLYDISCTHHDVCCNMHYKKEVTNEGDTIVSDNINLSDDSIEYHPYTGKRRRC